MIPIRDYNPATRTPYVTIALIASCILVFIWQLSLDQRSGEILVRQFGFIPALLFGHASWAEGAGLVPSWATLVSSMFLHGSVMHLAGNMLYLWIFGNNIEDVMGHGRFAIFYLLCGLVAAMAQALPDPGSTIPMIGASGAISGVLGAYLLLFPKVQVQVVIPIGFFMMRKLPAGWLLGIWIAFQVISGLAADPSGGGVAWWAHVGGFVAGMALVHLFRQESLGTPSDPGLPSERAPTKPTGRSRIPDSTRRVSRRPEQPPHSESPSLTDRPTVQRRREPPSRS